MNAIVYATPAFALLLAARYLKSHWIESNNRSRNAVEPVATPGKINVMKQEKTAAKLRQMIADLSGQDVRWVQVVRDGAHGDFKIVYTGNRPSPGVLSNLEKIRVRLSAIYQLEGGV